MSRNQKQGIRHHGFTLIETLVAVLVLMLAITGPLSLYSRFISQTDQSLHTYVASYLAEEGYYLMYQKLYQNMNITGLPDQDADQLTGLTGCDSSIGCGINFDGSITNPSSPCGTGNEENCRLYIDASTKRYTHASSGNTPSMFQRIVTYRVILQENAITPSYCTLPTILRPSASYAEIQIVSRVRWQEDGVWTQVSLSRSIFDPVSPTTRCI